MQPPSHPSSSPYFPLVAHRKTKGRQKKKGKQTLVEGIAARYQIIFDIFPLFGVLIKHPRPHALRSFEMAAFARYQIPNTRYTQRGSSGTFCHHLLCTHPHTHFDLKCSSQATVLSPLRMPKELSSLKRS